MVKKNLTAWFIGVSLFLMFFDYLGWAYHIETAAEFMIIPIKQAVYQTNIMIRNFGSLVVQYSYIRQTFEEKLRLQKHNEELLLQTRVLTDENFKLRKQLEAPMPASYKFIPAKVLGISRFMEIGVGDEDGVKIGMTVVDGQVLLGKVTAISPHRSSVALLTDSEIKVAARTSRGTKGLVVGSLGQIILLDKVLQKDDLFIDDQVETSGEDDFPPNLLIGKIVFIKSEDVEVYKQAKIEPPLEFTKENNVFVISSL